MAENFNGKRPAMLVLQLLASPWGGKSRCRCSRGKTPRDSVLKFATQIRSQIVSSDDLHAWSHQTTDVMCTITNSCGNGPC